MVSFSYKGCAPLDNPLPLPLPAISVFLSSPSLSTRAPTRTIIFKPNNIVLTSSVHRFKRSMTASTCQTLHVRFCMSASTFLRSAASSRGDYHKIVKVAKIRGRNEGSSDNYPHPALQKINKGLHPVRKVCDPKHSLRQFIL